MVVYTIDDLRNEIESLSESGRALTKQELEKAFKLTVAVQRANVMRLKAQIQRNRDRPMLNVYMNDGWGANVSERNAVTSGDHLVQRSGKFRHEFIIERGIVKSMEGAGQDWSTTRQSTAWRSCQSRTHRRLHLPHHSAVS